MLSWPTWPFPETPMYKYEYEILASAACLFNPSGEVSFSFLFVVTVVHLFFTA
jgi:hypothetical protein